MNCVQGTEEIWRNSVGAGVRDIVGTVPQWGIQTGLCHFPAGESVGLSLTGKWRMRRSLGVASTRNFGCSGNSCGCTFARKWRNVDEILFYTAQSASRGGWTCHRHFPFPCCPTASPFSRPATERNTKLKHAPCSHPSTSFACLFFRREKCSESVNLCECSVTPGASPSLFDFFVVFVLPPPPLFEDTL